MSIKDKKILVLVLCAAVLSLAVVIFIPSVLFATRSRSLHSSQEYYYFDSKTSLTWTYQKVKGLQTASIDPRLGIVSQPHNIISNGPTPFGSDGTILKYKNLPEWCPVEEEYYVAGEYYQNLIISRHALGWPWPHAFITEYYGILPGDDIDSRKFLDAYVISEDLALLMPLDFDIILFFTYFVVVFIIMISACVATRVVYMQCAMRSFV